MAGTQHFESEGGGTWRPELLVVRFPSLMPDSHQPRFSNLEVTCINEAHEGYMNGLRLYLVGDSLELRLVCDVNTWSVNVCLTSVEDVGTACYYFS